MKRTTTSGKFVILSGTNVEVPPEWVDGKVGVTVQQWGQREYDSGRTSGIEAGMLSAYTLLIDQATEHFKKGEDTTANIIRKIAYEIKDKASKEKAPRRA